MRCTCCDDGFQALEEALNLPERVPLLLSKSHIRNLNNCLENPQNGRGTTSFQKDCPNKISQPGFPCSSGRRFLHILKNQQAL